MKNKKKQLRKLKFNKNIISSLTNIKGGAEPTTNPPETFPYIGNCFDPHSENGQCISLDGLADCNSLNPDIACPRDTGTIKVNPPNDTDVFGG